MLNDSFFVEKIMSWSQYQSDYLTQIPNISIFSNDMTKKNLPIIYKHKTNSQSDGIEYKFDETKRKPTLNIYMKNTILLTYVNVLSVLEKFFNITYTVIYKFIFNNFFDTTGSTTSVVMLSSSLINQLKQLTSPTTLNYYRVAVPGKQLVLEVINRVALLATPFNQDISALGLFIDAIPVFFTRSPLKYAIGEEPKFSVISKWIRVLDAIEYLYDESVEMILEDFDGKGEFFVELNYFLPDFEEFFSEMFEEANDLLRI